MGFIQPAPPPVDMDEWRKQSYLARIKPLAQDWGVNGFGTPYAAYLLYVVKLIVYVAAAALVISTTSGLGGIGEIDQWWTEPIVWQKFAVWTLLWEILGLGAGSMPLTFRFAPMIGGLLYWLRPGTVRQPPFADKVPLTAGSTRTIGDVALYAGVLAIGAYLLFANGADVAGTAAGRLDPLVVALLLAVWALLGLRDKVSFLAGRPEVYGSLLIVFLFPLENIFVGSQLVLFFIWWGAAASKLNGHFPYVISVMISNTPWNRSKKMKAQLWEDYPEDMRPSAVSRFSAHLGTVVELGLPLVLLLSAGGTIGWLAVAGMVIFHIHITSTFPLGVPLEWNLFMIFGLFFMFGEYGDVPFSTLDAPLLIVLLALIGIALPVLGNFRPDLVSFLPSMRYYAGTWATSLWMFNRETKAEERMDTTIKKSAPIVIEQLAKVYDREQAELLLGKGIAFRSMHSHGRGLNALLFRAVDDVDAYHVREGELQSNVVCGWNFGDGHFHNEGLLDAVQERCGFDPGDLYAIVLESEPATTGRQHYRIIDAAAGPIEEGWIEVADMEAWQPWLDGSTSPDFPVDVTWAATAPGNGSPAPGPSAPGPPGTPAGGT